jgi:hypothetical protein
MGGIDASVFVDARNIKSRYSASVRETEAHVYPLKLARKYHGGRYLADPIQRRNAERIKRNIPDRRADERQAEKTTHGYAPQRRVNAATTILSQSCHSNDPRQTGLPMPAEDGAESWQLSRQKRDAEEIKHESPGDKVAGDPFGEHTREKAYGMRTKPAQGRTIFQAALKAPLDRVNTVRHAHMTRAVLPVLYPHAWSASCPHASRLARETASERLLPAAFSQSDRQSPAQTCSGRLPARGPP